MTEHVRTCHALRGMTKSELYEVFDELPMDATDQQIMDMRYVRRMRFGDIGEAVHLSEDAVKRRHARMIADVGREA